MIAVVCVVLRLMTRPGRPQLWQWSPVVSHFTISLDLSVGSGRAEKEMKKLSST